MITIPGFSPAVRWYRFRNAAERMGVTEIDLYDDGKFTRKNWAEDLAGYFAENGLSWDLVWTNLYTEPMQGILDALREYGAKVVVDVDDLFTAVPKGNLAHSHWHGRGRQQYTQLIKEADRVVTSTPYLADVHGAEVAYNFIEPSQWDFEARVKSDPDEVVILFSGGTGRAGDYMATAKPIKAAMDLPNTKMVFMGAFPEWALRYPAGKAIWCRWVPIELYPKMLRWIDPDIMVSPLEHNEFNLAKSNLKWLEAGAVGSAFVGERWGEYERTVEDGVTGVLAEGGQEWTDKLVWLCTNEAERAKIAKAGQAEVLRNWTWDKVGPLWERAVLGKVAAETEFERVA